MLWKLLYKKRVVLGEGTIWRNRVVIHAMDHGRVSIGKNCFLNYGSTIFAKESVSIGDDTIMGENVKIYDHNHRFNLEAQLIREQGDITSPVKIGRNCWISSNVMILKGVTVGDNVVIGANCVITEDIPSDHIVRLDSSNYVMEKIRKVRGNDS
ncbi:acyltransferase [Streptococcus saliviloxodontae]